MALPIINRLWSESPYLLNSDSDRYCRSVHESQLHTTSLDVSMIETRNADGTVIATQGDLSHEKAQIMFTGGTDDPSIELRFVSSDDIGHRIIQFKFGAFVSDKVNSRFNDRQIHDFHPSRLLRPSKLGTMFLGPTNFSNSLYNLQWTNTCQEEGRVIMLSWKSESMVTSRIHAHLDDVHPETEVVTNIRNLEVAENPVNKALEIKVKVEYSAELEYRYRYLLSCQTNLQAFWRLRTLQDITCGSIPLDICKDYAFDCQEVFMMEITRPGLLGHKYPLGYPYHPNDPLYTTTAICLPGMFTSKAATESCLKAPLLYEEHIVSEMRKRYLDGYHQWQCLNKPLLQSSSISTSIEHLMSVTFDIDYHGESAAPLPEIGSQIIITWNKPGVGKYVMEDCKVIARSWNFVKSEKTIKKRCIIAALVSQGRGDTALSKLHEDSYRPHFRFSCQSRDAAFILGAIDKVLFGTEEKAREHWDSLKSILISGDRIGPLNDTPLTVEDKPFVAEAIKSLGRSQEKAFQNLLGSTVSIVRGPPDSGKTFLASKFASVCINAREKVLLVCKSRVEACKLFQVAVKTAEQLDLPTTLRCGMAYYTTNRAPLTPQGTDLHQLYHAINSAAAASRPQMDQVTALFITLDELRDPWVCSFCPTVLILDQAEQIHQHWLFAICGQFIDTLRKAALFGDSRGFWPKSMAGSRNHLRTDLESSAETLFSDTDFPRMQLRKRYCADPQLSHLPFSIGYRDLFRPRKIVVDNTKSNSGPPEREKMQHWLVTFLGRRPEDQGVSESSVFVNVKDGICLRMRNSSTCVNHQNMVMVLRILTSLREHGISCEDVIILNFYPYSVPILRKFYNSQGWNCRVEHVASEQIKARDNLVAIIDCADTVSPDESDPHVYEKAHIVATLLNPKALRIIVGQELRKAASPDYRHLSKTWEKVFLYHKERKLVKDVEIGDALLEFEELLQPEFYHAGKMYDDLRAKRDAIENHMVGGLGTFSLI